MPVVYKAARFVDLCCCCFDGRLPTAHQSGEEEKVTTANKRRKTTADKVWKKRNDLDHADVMRKNLIS